MREIKFVHFSSHFKASGRLNVDQVSFLVC